MDKYDLLKEKLIKFNKDRDWDQFHSPENLAKSIVIEAGELLECFQWNNNYELTAVTDEMADIFAYLINLADRLNVNLIDITDKKIDKNALKYPIEKSKGKSNKYDKL
ncbi:MAG: nucleotide pyrophosphohydrolase [Erysipelotrichaceae bacterium]|nr:nucleotide pyrophosphohydrolase [Erysipelotrichaceae bacterium]